MPSLFAVAPVLVGPLQVLLAILPALLLSLGGLLLAMFKPSVVWAGMKLLWRQKLAVIVVAALATGLIYAKRTFFPSRSPEVLAAEADARGWPMFRGGLSRRGTVGSAGGPTRGGLNWSFAGEVQTFYATPAVVGNRVYIASADKGPLRDRGAIYCLDADTGGVVWSSAPEGFRATFSSPAISGDFLVGGEGLHYTTDARIVCLDVAHRGEVLWTYRTSSHVESSPCIDGDRVYIGAGDDGYYCFGLQPDASGRPVMLWHVPGEKFPDAETPPAVCDGRVYVGLGMGGRAVCCLDAETGDEFWRAETPYPVFAPPTVVVGRVFVGMGNGNFIESAEEVQRKELEKLQQQGAGPQEIAAAEKRLRPVGQVWCLDAQSGDVFWKFDTGRTILGAVAATEEHLYFGSRDGYVYCVSHEGDALGKWNAHAPIVTSPAVDQQHVYVVTETGKLYGLSAEELELVWEATLGFEGPFLSSPTVARGHVYVGSQQDGLLCLGMPGGREPDPRWAGRLGGPGQGGCTDNQPLPDSGRFAWGYPKSAASAGGDDPQQISITAPPACLGESLYVAVGGTRPGLICFHDDPQGKGTPSEAWFAESAHGVWLSPAATRHAVCFADGRPGDTGRHLHCVDPSDGSPRWRLPLKTAASGAFVLLEEGGLVADRAGELACFDASGKVAWRSLIGNVAGVPDHNDAMIVTAVDDSPALVALDRLTGKQLWRVKLDAVPTAGPVLRKDAVYLGTDRGVARLRLVDGSEFWHAEAGQPAGALAVRKNRIAYVNAASELVLLETESGSVETKLPGALPNVPPLVSRDAVLYASTTGLMRLRPADEEPGLWMKISTSWLGHFASPPVMANSRVYFGTDKGRLICLKAK